jgi:CRP/FNR family transcriptional regulator, cyclic AMP receptor protein
MVARSLEAAVGRVAWRITPEPPLRRYEPGRMLIRAEDPATTVFVLRRGHVRVFHLSEQGQETTTAILGPRQIVGVSPLLGRPTYHAFAEALDMVEVWALARDGLLDQLLVDRELLGLIVGALAQRLSQEVALLGDIALLSVDQRIREVAGRFAQQDATAPRLTNRALADLVGARPETLSRALHGRRARRSAAPAPVSPQATVPTIHEPRPAESAFAPTDLEAIAGAGLTRRCLSGQRVELSHSAVPRLYIVREGVVRLFLEDQVGRQITVDVVNPGECFGLPALHASGAPGVTAEALGAVAVVELDLAMLMRLLDRSPRLAHALLSQVAARMERVERRLCRAHGPTACARLASLLDELAETVGEAQGDGSRLLPAGWTHAVLGREVGLRRETVTRSLRSLANEGRVRQRGRRLVVCGLAGPT